MSVFVCATTLIGGPIIGAIGEFAGARWGLGIAAVSCFMTALYLVIVRRSMDASPNRIEDKA
jgi:hypothetical protein